MWIAMNDSFVSIVQSRDCDNEVVVRARVREDLVALFPPWESLIIESEDGDYRFRLFMDKETVSWVIKDRIMDINYDNFKNSINKTTQSWRYRAYTKIWQVLFGVQHERYGVSEEYSRYQLALQGKYSSPRQNYKSNPYKKNNKKRDWQK